MNIEASKPSENTAGWLFSIGEGTTPINVEGLIAVEGYFSDGRPPEEVAIIEKASAYGAHSVFFEAERTDRSPVAHAFVFRANDDDAEFAELHKRLWSWGGVPLVYRASPGLVQLFRCAHEPDFIGPNSVPVCNPIRELKIASIIAEQDVWWDAAQIRNGTIWDDPVVCKLMLSPRKAAHRTLVKEVQKLAEQVSKRDLLSARLRRKLLILSLLIAYLEERSVLRKADFAQALKGAERFFQVLGDGPALVKLLRNLEERFNGHVFALNDEERAALVESSELENYARLVEGYEDSAGQINLWRLYSFKDLPVELISNIYQLFVNDKSTAVYTPPALVRLMLEETLSWDRLDKLMEGDGVILDPACGSGVFLVEAYKRLVLHWRYRNGWKSPRTQLLKSLLMRVHGIDLEEGAVELAGFSLCLSLCDALQPEVIRSSVKLFPPLAGLTVHHRCFFDAKSEGLVKKPIAAIVGNPPFKSSLRTEGAKTSFAAYTKAKGTLPDKQLAYLFLNDAMDMLAPDGVMAMIQPSGFLYNQNVSVFRRTFFTTWKVREILDFVSVRGLFKKGSADPKIVVVIAEADKPTPDGRILHAIFRRNGRASSEQGFDIDYYDLHWFRNIDAEQSNDLWRANLLGGARVHDFIQRLRHFPTLGDFARGRSWTVGEGFNPGAKGKSKPAEHLIGKPLLPTRALSGEGIDDRLIENVPDQPIEGPRTLELFTPPLLLIKEHENLSHALWSAGYLTYKNEIVGFAAPKKDGRQLARIDAWLKRERTALRAYVAGISARLFTQRATAIFSAEVLALPYPEDESLDLSRNETIITEDIVDYQREFIRLGMDAPVMQMAPEEALDSFDEVFIGQINAVYSRKKLRALQSQGWSGAICKAYSFGRGKVDWSGADELRDRLDTLLHEQRSSGLTVTRIIRLYDKNFVFLLKPDRHRFWTRSIALRDADDVLADLRGQGF